MMKTFCSDMVISMFPLPFFRILLLKGSVFESLSKKRQNFFNFKAPINSLTFKVAAQGLLFQGPKRGVPSGKTIFDPIFRQFPEIRNGIFRLFDDTNLRQQNLSQGKTARLFLFWRVSYYPSL